jgi:hypothetical protein
VPAGGSAAAEDVRLHTSASHDTAAVSQHTPAPASAPAAVRMHAYADADASGDGRSAHNTSGSAGRDCAADVIDAADFIDAANPGGTAAP